MKKHDSVAVLFVLAVSGLFLISSIATVATADRPYTSISGWVHDANTGLAVVGATVTGAGLTTTTGSDGTYILTPVYQMTGTLVVTASRNAYVTQSQTVTMVYHVAGHAYFSLSPKWGIYGWVKD